MLDSSCAVAGTFMAYQPDRPVESGVIASLNGAIGKAKWARSSTRQQQRPQSGQKIWEATRPWCELSCSQAISRFQINLRCFAGLYLTQRRRTWPVANWSNNILLLFVARRDKWLAAGTLKKRLAPAAEILQSFVCRYLPTAHLRRTVAAWRHVFGCDKRFDAATVRQLPTGSWWGELAKAIGSSAPAGDCPHGLWTDHVKSQG